MASSAANLVLGVLVLSSCLALPRSAEDVERPPNCPSSFNCGKLGKLGWPFANSTDPPDCGKLIIDGCERGSQTIQVVEEPEKRYELLAISPNGTIHLRDGELDQRLKSSKHCLAFEIYFPEQYFPEKIQPTLHLLKCDITHPPPPVVSGFHYQECKKYDIYYNQLPQPPPLPPPAVASQPHNCSIIWLPLKKNATQLSDDLFQYIASDFFLESCYICEPGEGSCGQDSEGNFHCIPRGKKDDNKWSSTNDKQRLKLKIGLGIGCFVAIALLLCAVLFIFRRYRQKSASSGFLSTKTDFDPSWKIDFEGDGAYYGVPVFAYSELEEATNCFDPSKELGEGGFGTVYHGQLRDGREVAVKRLYENNCKRVQQFMNEIKILTRLRHKNLVTLYGCTSRHSRELLLVYEFISNGTVADHLRGDRSAPTSLGWPVRLGIAVETANALTYLHASGIIHRDVKTSNILLDNNFCVKVADFGLSRLFPNDVTHVSTAPQGTPGYVDPEYHMCYQLTERSDVYSFGVVLIELISSLPAVDISRDRAEINLANLAVKRIQNREFSDFLDPCLRFESDSAVRRMVILVAELAFQCLQRDREQRPSMEEVLRILKGIQGEHDDDDDDAQVPEPAGSYNRAMMALHGNVRRVPAWLESEDGVLVKRTHLQSSPISVADKWVDGSTASSTVTV